MLRRERGFTLLEMVIVIGILVILAGTVVATLDGTSDDCKAQIARSEIGTLREACIKWRTDMGRWPARLSYLSYELDEIEAELGTTAYDVEVPPALRTFNPTTRRGWRGPYVALTHGAAQAHSRVVLRTKPSTTTLLSFIIDPFHVSEAMTPATPLDARAYRYPRIDQPGVDPNTLSGVITITCAGPDGQFTNVTMLPGEEAYADSSATASALGDNAGPVLVGSNP